MKTIAKNGTCYIINNDIICFANHITYLTFGLQENRNRFSKFQTLKCVMQKIILWSPFHFSQNNRFDITNSPPRWNTAPDGHSPNDIPAELAQPDWTENKNKLSNENPLTTHARVNSRPISELTPTTTSVKEHRAPKYRICTVGRVVPPGTGGSGDISPIIGKNMDFHVQSILIFSQHNRLDITTA